MNRVILLGSLVFLIVFSESSLCFAQQGGSGPGREGRAGSRSPILKALDTSGDRVLSTEEIEAAVESLKGLDANNDGQLTRNEYGFLGSQRKRSQQDTDVQSQQGQRKKGHQDQGARWQNGPRNEQNQRPRRTPIVLSEGPLPNVNAVSPDGTPIKVRDLIKEKYTVIKTGCLTCPEFLVAYKELEATAADYEKLGVQFYYIYQSLRHPEREGYVQPQNTKERLMHVAEAKERLGTKVPWIMDTMDDSFRVAMRSNSNSVFVISPDSKIAYAADRMNGDGLRRALIDLIGPVENPTSAQDLNLPEMPRFPPKNITNEIRVERPQGLVILKTTPTEPEETYYVKMRAEAEKSVLETGKGDMYLGFFPDPIHDAHWNNLTPPMKYEFELPDGVTIDPPMAEANKGPGDSDTQPRQFKLKVNADKTPDDVKLKIHYFACAPGMCVAKTQEYTITFAEMDLNSRTYSFNRGQGAPGGVPKASNRQLGPRGRAAKPNGQRRMQSQ